MPLQPWDPGDQQYAFAVGLYDRGEWALAAREFQSFLRQYPQHPQAGRANFLLAEALLQLGQYEDALVRFKQYWQQEPGSLWAAKALFRSGEAAFLAGKTDQAASLLKEFLNRYPTDPLGAYALLYLGQLARKGNQWSTASEYFRQGLERFPQSPLQLECQLELAKSLEALGKAEEALRLYQTVAQKDSGPVAAEAQFRSAALLYNLQRYPEAAAAFQLYERRFPNSGQAAYARLYRGFALFHLHHWQEAEQCFASLAALDSRRASSGMGLRKPSSGTPPASPSPLSPSMIGSAAGPEAPGPSFSGLLAFSGLSPEQLQSLQRQGQYWLAMVQREEGQWAESAKTFSQLAQTAAEPADQVECHFYAADGWLRAQEPKAALQQFELALKVIDQNTGTEQASSANLSSAGTANQAAETSRPQQISQWLDKILRGKLQTALLLQDHQLADRTAKEFFHRCGNSPLAADVARWQAQSLIQQEQFQEAIQLLQPWAQRAPGQDLACHIQYLLAYAYRATGQLQEAQAQITLLLQANHPQWKFLAQLAQANILIAQKQYQQAVPVLEAYLASAADQPDRTTAQAQLALCYAWLGQTDKAQELYKQLAQKHSADSWFVGWSEQVAEAALETGNVAWARNLFEQLANQAEPAYAQRALLGLGWTQYRAGQFPEAAATLARLLAMEKVSAPLAAEAAFLRARLLAKLRQPDGALALFEMVVDKYPDTKWFGPALLAAGRLEAQMGQHTQAVQRFQRYVQTFPQASDLDTALYDWAWSLKELGQADQSQKLFERIHHEFPQSPYWAEVTLRLAQQAYQSHQYERARQLASAVLAHSAPDLRPYALYLQMQIAASQADWDSVSQLVHQLLQQHPGSPLQIYAEFWQVELMFRKKDFQTAGKLLENFAKKYPSPPAGLAPLVGLRQAQLLAHQGRWDEVIQAASRLRDQYPQFDQLYEADYLLGRALARKARFDEAREAFQRVIRSPQGAHTETAAMAQWYIGETYFHQQDYQTALRAYLLVEVLYAYPEWQALALLEAARCHQKLGHQEQAQQLYERLLRRFPDTAAARQYRQHLGGSAGQPPSASSEPTSAPNPSVPDSFSPKVPISEPPSDRPEKNPFQLQQNSGWKSPRVVITPIEKYFHINFFDCLFPRNTPKFQKIPMPRMTLEVLRFPSFSFFT